MSCITELYFWSPIPELRWETSWPLGKRTALTVPYNRPLPVQGYFSDLAGTVSTDFYAVVLKS